MLSELRPWGTTVCVIAGRITQEQNHRVGCFQLRPRELLSETVAVRMGHRLGGSSQQRGRGRGLSGRSRSEQGRETLNGVKGEAWAGVSACYCRSGSVSRSLCPTPTLCDPMDYRPPVSSFLGIYIYVYIYIRPEGFPGGASGKEPTCQFRWKEETQVQSLFGSGRSLEEGLATHSSILVWRIPMDRGAWQAAAHSVA